MSGLLGIKLAGRVIRMEEGRCSFKILTNKPTRKRPLGRARRRWDDSFRTDLKEIGANTTNLIDSAHDRDYWGFVVNSSLNFRVP